MGIFGAGGRGAAGVGGGDLVTMMPRARTGLHERLPNGLTRAAAVDSLVGRGRSAPVGGGGCWMGRVTGVWGWTGEGDGGVGVERGG